MAWTAPDVALMAMFDRLAYQKGFAVEGDDGTGTDLWTRVDATEDETFENRVETPRLTALDTAMLAMPFGDFNEMGNVLTDISSYANQDLGLGSFDGYLTDRRLRLDLRGAEIWQERYSSTILSIANIASRGDGGASAPGLELGDMLGNGGGAGAFTVGAEMSETTNGPSPILARVTVKGAVNWEMLVTCDHATGITPATENITLVVAANAPVGTIYVLGEELMAGGEAAGQTVIELAATTQFAAGQKVLLTQWTGNIPARTWDQQEMATILSVQPATSITLTAPIRNTYTATARTFVYPCFIGVSAVDDDPGLDGTNLDRVYFYPAPDRALKL